MRKIVENMVVNTAKVATGIVTGLAIVATMDKVEQLANTFMAKKRGSRN